MTEVAGALGAEVDSEAASVDEAVSVMRVVEVASAVEGSGGVAVSVVTVEGGASAGDEGTEEAIVTDMRGGHHGADMEMTDEEVPLTEVMTDQYAEMTTGTDSGAAVWTEIATAASLCPTEDQGT